MKKSIFTLIMLGFVTAIQAQPLLQDASVRKGTLANGLTYYVRHNAKDPWLAEFYIAQRVGSILEEPRQRGLAHFLEHMAFNGTENFPGAEKGGLREWCESKGIKFGANLNAYTSVDQTVYNISSAPVSKAGVTDTCLLILHDWSHYLLLKDDEIDKERGVIHEEWRTRRAGMAVQRLMERAMPKVYQGTKYEDCLPIGSMDIVDNFPYQDLRDYYQKWYRPDLQAVVIVGDIDVDRVEQKVQRLFSKIPLPKQRARREYFPVTDNDSMIVTIQKDAEQPIVLFNLYQKRDATPDEAKNTPAYFRADYVDDLIGTMLNDRLAELRQQANPPFQSATGRASSFFLSRTKEAFSLSISCKQDNVLGGIITAVGAAERARQHGFTPSELERAKKLYLNAAERRYNQRDDYRNSHYVNNCIQHFLNSEPLQSVEQKLENTRLFDREVTLDEVNQAVRELITDQNQVVVVYAPDKESVKLPSGQQIEEVVLAAQQQQYAPYAEQPVADRLVSQLPTPGTIVSEQPYKHGFTELTLSNGMKVYAKKTDYETDAVSLRMKGEGGTSLYPDEDIPNFTMIASAVTEGGVGDFDATTLRRMLTGKSVRVNTSVGSRGQSISGGSSVKDMQTLFELAYLYFTSPRRDTTAFQSFVNRQRSFLTNRNASPKVDYNDSCYAVLYNHHPRLEPVVSETLDRVNYDRMLQMYKERFSDASNFNTVIIGHVSPDAIKPLLCQYLASLPSTNKNEKINWKNVATVVGGESVHKFIKKQATPLANVSIYYTADIPFSAQADLELDMLTRVLQIAYTDSVREEKGGTYGVRVATNFEKDDHPTALLQISYNADPSRYDELNPVVYQQLRLIAERGLLVSSMDKVKKYLIKQYAQMIITNGYWDYIIWHQIEDGIDFDKDYIKMVEATTPEQIQRMAQQILAAKRRIEITMLSE